MNEPTVVDRDAWIAARTDLLALEKAFTRERDALTERRRELPWLEISEDYEFASPSGSNSLADLFGDKSQLLIYHFMMGPDWEEGCPSCSFWADGYDGLLPHLRARDTNLVAVSRAPVDAIEAYRARMGWSFPWFSSLDSAFNFDFGVSFTPEQVESGDPIYNYGSQGQGEEMPGLSALRRTPEGRVFLTYQTFSRGLDICNSAYHLLDMTSKGRDEADLEWSMAWLRRHDQYPG